MTATPSHQQLRIWSTLREAREWRRVGQQVVASGAALSGTRKWKRCKRCQSKSLQCNQRAGFCFGHSEDSQKQRQKWFLSFRKIERIGGHEAATRVKLNARIAFRRIYHWTTNDSCWRPTDAWGAEYQQLLKCSWTSVVLSKRLLLFQHHGTWNRAWKWDEQWPWPKPGLCRLYKGLYYNDLQGF